MKYLKFLFTPLLLSFFITFIAEGRWEKYEDASTEIKFFNNTTKINKDGTYEEIIEFQAVLLKESERNNFAQYSFTYNENSSHITILEAKTIYNGKQYTVTKDMIEDKPLASPGQGFDQLRQVMISFPKIELGAEIYLKYKYTEKKAPLDNFFGHSLGYGKWGYWKASTTKIISELPLKLKVNDPKNVLKVVQSAEGGASTINITLQKPLYEALINEPQNGIINTKHNTWVSLSSLSNWEDLSKKLAPGYYRVINQPLPGMFALIADSAANLESDEEKINFVTSSLNEKIQYMGDWRSIEGRYFPRDLDKIAYSQTGDCKDFTASTAAILKKLGYKVQPILVKRGILNISNPESLPSLNSFNHVLLKVTNKNKKAYWIDPTNVASMAQNIFPDIANKTALILDLKEAGEIKIPEIKPEDSKVISKNNLVIKDNVIDQQGQITTQGGKSLTFTAAGLYYSKAQLRDMAFRMVSGDHLEENEKKFLELPDLTSRIVKDLVIKYEFQRKNQIFKTNKGAALRLGGNDLIEEIIGVVPDQVTDIFIGVPGIYESHTVIKNTLIKDCEKLNFKINSPWLSINRSCKQQGEGTELIDIITIQKSFITNEELKAAEYKNLKERLENNFRGAAIIID